MAAVWLPAPPGVGLLGGSWVAINGLISPLIWVRSIVTLLITLLITTHDPPSKVQSLRLKAKGFPESPIPLN